MRSKENALITVNRVAPIIDSPNGEKLQKRVWAELAEKLEKIKPGVLQNI